MSKPAAPSPLEPPSPSPTDHFELPLDDASASSPTAEPEEPAPPKRSWREELQDVDWLVVRSLLGREALLTLRSRAWARLLAWFAFGTALLALLPILYRLAPGHWHRPTGQGWLVIWSLGTALGLLTTVSAWTRRRISRELRAGALEEIVLTGSGPADILLGKAIATAWIAGLLVVVTLPPLLLATAIGGEGLDTVLRLSLTLGLSAYLGLCVGLEYSFRRPGSRSTFGRMWNWYYLLLLLGNLGRFGRLNFLTLPRQWFMRYNPVSTLLSATGTHLERWPVGLLVFLLLLLALTLINFRLLRREWSQAVDRVAAGSWFQRLLRPRRARKNGDNLEPAEPVNYGTNALATFEGRFGHRLRVPRWAEIVAGLVLVGLLFVPDVTVTRWLFGMLLWLACLVAAHNGCAPFARERDRGGWEELALLPVGDRELVVGKLSAGVRTWLPIVGGALTCLLMGYFRSPAAGFGWLVWGMVALLLLPPAFTALGALFGLVNPASDEAHWRVAILSTGLPALLLTGHLSEFQLIGAEALSPLFAALSSAGTGTVGVVGWLGTVLYALAGMIVGWLVVTRVRNWALDSPIS